MLVKFKRRYLTLNNPFEFLDENDNLLYEIEGNLLNARNGFFIYDISHQLKGFIKQVLWEGHPSFDIYDENNNLLGSAERQYVLLKSKYSLSYRNWSVSGDIWGNEFSIADLNGESIAVISREDSYKMASIYNININNPADLLDVVRLILMIGVVRISNLEL